MSRVYNIRKERERNPIQKLIDWVSYEDGIYDLEAPGRSGRDLGFAFLCNPILGGGEDVAQAMQDSISPNNLPAGTIVSASLLCMPGIKYRTDMWAATFNDANDKRIQYVKQFRQRMFENAAEDEYGLIDGRMFRPVERMVVFSVRLPASLPPSVDMRLEFRLGDAGESKMSKKEVAAYEAAQNGRTAIRNLLDRAGLGPIDLDPPLLFAISRQMFGPEVDVRPHVVHPNQLLKHQFFDADDRVARSQDGSALMVGRKWVAMGMSVRKYPSQSYIGMMNEASGDFFTDLKVLHDPFVMTTHIRVPDMSKQRAEFNNRFRLVMKQSQSVLVNFIPSLKHKHDEYEFVDDQLDRKGATLADCITTVVVYSRSRRKLVEHEKTVNSMMEAVGFQMQRERDALINVFEAQLPMNCSPEQFDWIGHRGRVFNHNAAAFMPLYGDWKGTGSAGILLTTRRGQIASIDIFDTDSNYNFTVTAASGKGKTFFANDVLASVLARGGIATIIDVGGGFKRNILMNGGEYMDIGPGRNQCFNPISDVPLDAEGLISNDEGEKELVVDMFTLMCCGSEPATQEDRGHIERAIDEATMAEGNDADAMTVRRMLEEKAAQFPSCAKLAHGLYPFTEGRYRSFLCGRANVDMSWRLGGVELQELANMPDLRLVVLAMVLNRATTQMYSTDRSIPKLLCADEAWDILGAESADTTAASRTLSGVTRKARKHGGATGFITQNVTDWMNNKSMQAIFSTSEWMFLLGQQAENIERFVNEKVIMLNDFEKRLMTSVDTVKGKYSEVMVRMASSGVSEVMRFVVDPYSYALQTSDSKEAPVIDAIMKRTGCPVEVACAKFAVDRFKDRAVRLGIDQVVKEYMEAQKRLQQGRDAA